MVRKSCFLLTESSSYLRLYDASKIEQWTKGLLQAVVNKGCRILSEQQRPCMCLGEGVQCKLAIKNLQLENSWCGTIVLSNTLLFDKITANTTGGWLIPETLPTSRSTVWAKFGLDVDNRAESIHCYWIHYQIPTQPHYPTEPPIYIFALVCSSHTLLRHPTAFSSPSNRSLV